MASRPRLRAGQAIALAVAAGVLVTGVPSAMGTAAARDDGSSRASEGVPAFRHVFLIVGENTSANQINRKRAPYLAGSLKKRMAWLTNYHSLLKTASLGDYVGMTSGQFTRCEANDALPIHCHQGINNLFSQLDKVGAGWRLWAQSMDNPCDIFDHGSDWSRNVYSAHHNAAIYYTRIEGNRYDEALKPARECRKNDLPMGSTMPNSASRFNHALASGKNLGRFNMVVPNDCADGHDRCGKRNRVTQFDAFLRQEIPRIRNSPVFGSHSLILVTWDEGSDPPRNPHHVLLAALGSDVKPGLYGGRFTHYSLLRTLEDGFGIQHHLGAASKAAPISDIWR